TPEHCHMFELDRPLITNEELLNIKTLDHRGLRSRTLDTLFEVARGGEGLREALDALCIEANKALDEGYPILVLSDRKHDRKRAPIPSLLATSALHHHLIREGRRTRAALIVESGEPREVHHFCLLLGYGASAINPYLAYEIIHSSEQQE